MPKRRVYWDACVFIGLLNSEPHKLTETLAVWKEAELGKTEIWTSVLSIVEVYKAKSEGNSLSEQKDGEINNLFAQEFVELVVLDEGIARRAKQLLRTHHPACRKPTDGIHLATAALWNVDELHTWDRADLIALSGHVVRKDGKKLVICKPNSLPIPGADPDQHPFL